MVVYCLLALTTSLPCPHRVSIGFNFGDRFGNHNSVIPSASRREALAVWDLIELHGHMPAPVVLPNFPEECL